MDTKIHILLGFKIDDTFFGFHEGVLYQLPYMKSGRYYGLRVMKEKTTKAGWRYYHLKRKKCGIEKIRALCQNVNWELEKPKDIL